MTQDVLFKVYRKVGAFRGDAALSSWIYRITFNAAMSRLRTAKYQRTQAEERRDAANDGDERRRTRAPRSPTGRTWPTSRSSGRSCGGACCSAILALPAIYRAPVMLRDIQGMSTEEASAMLRVKDQTLKSRLHRGRLILRKQLADFAGGLHAAPAGLTARRWQLTSREACRASRRSSCKPSRYCHRHSRSQQHRVVERDALVALSDGSTTSTIPPGPSRTGSAAVRACAPPAATSGATKQLIVRRERPAMRVDGLRRRRGERVRARRPQRRDPRREPAPRRLVETRVSAKPPIVASSHGTTV